MGTPFDTSNLPALPSGGSDESRRRVEEAMLSRIEPQFAQDQKDLETRLLTSGIERGSDAWGREMDRLGRARNDARMQAVLSGGNEESRQVGLGQGLRSQALAEALQLRSQPLNELNALRTGGQLSVPQFGAYNGAGQPQAAPLMDAGIAQGNFMNQQYQQNMAGRNALLQALGNIGTNAMMAVSDEALKEDLTAIGTHPAGVPRYSWRWKGSSVRSSGVVAQELLKVAPHAVYVSPSGFLTVDYAAIGGQ